MCTKERDSSVQPDNRALNERSGVMVAKFIGGGASDTPPELCDKKSGRP